MIQAFSGGTTKYLYDAQSHTFESSHEVFRGAFGDGFPWEVLEVFSGPPKVAFSWRHWGKFTGHYKSRKGEGEIIELYGFAIVTLSANSKIAKIEAYQKFNNFLRALQGEPTEEDLKEKEKEISADSCPIGK